MILADLSRMGQIMRAQRLLEEVCSDHWVCPPTPASTVPESLVSSPGDICPLPGDFQLLTARPFLSGVTFPFLTSHLERWIAEALNFPPPAPLTWPCSVPMQPVKGEPFISISKGKHRLSAWPCANSGRVSSEDEWGWVGKPPANTSLRQSGCGSRVAEGLVL